MHSKQMLKDHALYLRRLLRHKRLVLEEGRKLELPFLQLPLHDWSKFLPDEWRAGVSFYHTNNGDDVALCKHYTRNRHHLQWCVRGDKTLPMPDSFRREMLAY